MQISIPPVIPPEITNAYKSMIYLKHESVNDVVRTCIRIPAMIPLRPLFPSLEAAAAPT